jgi:hypothetical protein
MQKNIERFLVAASSGDTKRIRHERFERISLQRFFESKKSFLVAFAGFFAEQVNCALHARRHHHTTGPLLLIILDFGIEPSRRRV